MELLGGDVDFKVVGGFEMVSGLFGSKSEGLIRFWLRESVLAYY